MGLIGQWALPTLKEDGVLIARCYDADPALTGTQVHGVPIHSANDLAADRPDFVIVTARHVVGPISAMLAALGIAHVFMTRGMQLATSQAFVTRTTPC